MKQEKILIIGKIPPPIGGVTIHVSRLISSLKKKKIPFDFKPLEKSNLWNIFFNIRKYKTVHIHSSNPIVRYSLVKVANIFNVISIVTIHGDLGRFKSKLKNKLDKWTICNATKSIVLNNKSYDLAKKWNSNTEILSTFIPPIEDNTLKENHIKNILQLKKYKDFLFCSNAYNLSYDKDNKEIYGIFELIKVFTKFPQYGLIFSDPSGVYMKNFIENKIEVPDNIYVINEEHSFYKVIEMCDASIRNTTTDGDSLSVKESLYLNKLTFTTDVVSRPSGSILYKRGDFIEVLHQLSDINISHLVKKENNIENGAVRLIELYNNYLYNEEN